MTTAQRSAAAVVVAALSSACCWLPLLLLGAGASAVGVGALLEVYRPYLLGAAVMLLAAGFHTVYLRKPACAPDGSCHVTDPRVVRLNRASLWAAVALVALLGALPDRVDALGTDTTTLAEMKQSVAVLRVGGMTCGGCAGTAKKALEALDGVTSADVSFEKMCARVVHDPRRTTTAQMIAAVKSAGYHASIDANACEADG